MFSHEIKYFCKIVFKKNSYRATDYELHAIYTIYSQYPFYEIIISNFQYQIGYFQYIKSNEKSHTISYNSYIRRIPLVTFNSERQIILNLNNGICPKKIMQQFIFKPRRHNILLKQCLLNKDVQFSPGLQLIPTSSLWPQLWTPINGCWHASKSISLPEHASSSRKIGPVPGP